MALIERIMRLNNDGSEDVLQSRTDLLPVHAFYAGMLEVAAGRMTPANFRAAFAISNVVEPSGKSDESDLVALIAAMPAAGTVARALFIGSIHSIFILAERRINGYHTAALVRAKLGI